jgi:prevent-host-death family protein
MASQPKSKTITATEASNHFGSVIDEAARGKSLFVVTRMGDPRAVVIGFEQYRHLVDQIEIAEEQNDSEIVSSLKQAAEDIRLGRGLTLEELDRMFDFTDEEIHGGD